MTAERWQALFWVGALAVLLLVLHLLSGILLPFVAGCGIAYFLDPAVDRLERRRVPRGAAAAAVLLVFFAALAVLLALLVPLIEVQAAELARQAPRAVEFGRRQIQAVMEVAQQQLSPDDMARLADLLRGWASSAAAWSAGLVEGLLTGGLALANLLSLIVVTPIVSFFLLRDWDRIIACVDDWLPRAHAATIRDQVHRIDATLAGFIHGQMLVGLILAAYYGAALTLLGLDFAVILGIVTGVMSFIPFFGVVTGIVLALGLGLVQFGPSPQILGILAIYGLGYGVESNYLSPKLVGKRVNLHPLWIVFALLAFGSLFGFLGILLAIPMAAVIGVLVRFALARYLASPLYDPANRPPARGG